MVMRTRGAIVSAWTLRALGVLATLVGCGRGDVASGPGASASAATGFVPARSHGERVRLLEAEQRRSSSAITPEDLQHLEVKVRRAAARALSRIADARAVELLSKSLADEDAEVVVFSAYGLGYACRGHERALVPRLALRAASLLANAARAANATAEKPAPFLSPLAAVTDALSRCATPEAEHTLRALVVSRGAAAGSAALALGTLASRRGRLEDETVVALLDAASQKPPLEESLYPFSRSAGLGEMARERLLGVARATLAGAPAAPGRSFAVRALGATGDAGAPDLASVVLDGKTPASIRADAARALARGGDAAQKELALVAEKLFTAEDSTSPARLESAEFGVLESVLSGLKARLPESAWLLRVATLPLPPASESVLARRVVRLRCGAASLTANPRKENPALDACDPDPKGRAGRLARLQALGRAPFLGRRLVAFRELVQSDDVLVRERALEQLTDHGEVQEAAALLASALGSKSPGEVATAAQVLAKRPDQAGAARGKADAPVDGGAPEVAPDPKLVEALLRAIDTWSRSRNPEVAATLFDAAAALEVLGAKPALETACKHSNPTLRARAESALRALGERDKSCQDFTPDATLPAELPLLVHAKQRLTFDTDVGPLFIDLDPALAPVAVTRAVELAKQGFYDGNAVHRVVPGFVAQFGDPGGDGYGGADRPLLRGATAPAPFEAGAVGVALGGRDTGSSQLFVTLGRHPHLDGNYALLGRAGPGWDRVVEGDRIIKVRVGPAD
jgi:cyclophilin family peptidyl-prolyl cis-trans isomerase/HEAT repeat protein